MLLNTWSHIFQIADGGGTSIFTLPFLKVNDMVAAFWLRFSKPLISHAVNREGSVMAFNQVKLFGPLKAIYLIIKYNKLSFFKDMNLMQ